MPWRVDMLGGGRRLGSGAGSRDVGDEQASLLYLRAALYFPFSFTPAWGLSWRSSSPYLYRSGAPLPLHTSWLRLAFVLYSRPVVEAQLRRSRQKEGLAREGREQALS